MLSNRKFFIANYFNKGILSLVLFKYNIIMTLSCKERAALLEGPHGASIAQAIYSMPKKICRKVSLGAPLEKLPEMFTRLLPQSAFNATRPSLPLAE
jgi:hypothetical protein